MKKSIITIIGAIYFVSASAFEINVFGNVTDVNNQQPLMNHSIEIIIQSTQGSVLYQNIASTDSLGNYLEIISITDSMNQNGFAYLITDSCGIDIIHVEYFDFLSNQIEKNFQVCSELSNYCDADYYYYQTIDPLSVQFLNNSIGEITEYLWDFGDGTYSDEENPYHTFPDFGEFTTTLFVAGDSCSDQFQNTIILKNDSTNDCEAMFIWEQSVQMPLTVNFTDQSQGDIFSWFWDFGDGNVSSEQNPQHSYSSAGYYNTYLQIVTIDSCISIYSEIINVIGDTAICYASFSYQLDTLNNTPHTYNFIDNSSENVIEWLWDFGDGEFSNEQNPIHVYDEGGFYDVSLTISSLDGGFYCTSDTTITISTLNYYYFGGQIFTGNYPINIDSTDNENIATVNLYRKISNSWYFMDSGEFWKYGYYWFYDKPEGEYMVMAQLTESSQQFSDYCPSYYPNSIDWKRSGTLVLNNNEQFTVNISLKPLKEFSAGIGNIIGNVSGDQTCNYQIMEEFSNIIVHLLNNQGEIIAYTYTDVNGYYQFDNLGFGYYKIKAEVPGKYTESYNIVINEQNYSLEQQLTVYCNNILGYDEYYSFQTLTISDPLPNPALNKTKLNIDSDSRRMITIELYNMNGIEVGEYQFTLYVGTNSIELDLSNIASGFYLLRLTDPYTNFQETKKLLIN